MSDFRVPLTTIVSVSNHDNADRLEVAEVYGYQVIVQKGRYRPGDVIVYVPIDSILPRNLEDLLFPEGSKIRLSGSRVRQIKIRGMYSQGMIVSPDDIVGIVDVRGFELESDLSEALGVVKYEPPDVESPTTGSGKQGSPKARVGNPHFHQYNGLTHLNYLPNVFLDDEVCVQEKLHGTNARAGIVPYVHTTLTEDVKRITKMVKSRAGVSEVLSVAWDSVSRRFKKLLGLAPTHENCFGSNTVQKFPVSGKKTSWPENMVGKKDVWTHVFTEMDVFRKLNPGEVVYGEIIGPRIQKNYSYGLDEPRFVLFDVKVYKDGSWSWLTPSQAHEFAIQRGFEFVPVLYRGQYDREHIKSLLFGPSAYCPDQPVREGVVVKSETNYNCEHFTGNRKALKWVSPVYLGDETNTDFH